MGDFAKLGLKKRILEVLAGLNFTQSLEVQDVIIPLIRNKENVVFTSRTGSGKTLCYLLGFLGKINPTHHVQMVVLVPTRELCIQVGKEMQKICEPLGISIGMIYGGRSVPGDYRTLNKKNQIIVGTPGRLLLHVNEKKLRVGDVMYVVFDEADQMFDNGFYTDCVYLKERVSSSAQIVLSSATLTQKVQDFIEQEIQNYTKIQVGDLIPKNIVQEKIYCEMNEKNELLLAHFSPKKFTRAMIFCNTKEKAYDICEFLEDHNFNTKALSGNLEQKERLKHLNLFKEGKINILVTTDVAARGLHIPQVDIVINYDVPTREEFYVHRIGRTGRKDAHGYSLTLICPEDVVRFESIERRYALLVKEV